MKIPFILCICVIYLVCVESTVLKNFLDSFSNKSQSENKESDDVKANRNIFTNIIGSVIKEVKKFEDAGKNFTEKIAESIKDRVKKVNDEVSHIFSNNKKEIKKTITSKQTEKTTVSNVNSIEPKTDKPNTIDNNENYPNIDIRINKITDSSNVSIAQEERNEKSKSLQLPATNDQNITRTPESKFNKAISSTTGTLTNPDAPIIFPGKTYTPNLSINNIPVETSGFKLADNKTVTDQVIFRDPDMPQMKIDISPKKTDRNETCPAGLIKDKITDSCIPSRENFSGGCPSGSERAPDDSCQEAV